MGRRDCESAAARKILAYVTLTSRKKGHLAMRGPMLQGGLSGSDMKKGAEVG